MFRAHASLLSPFPQKALSHIRPDQVTLNTYKTDATPDAWSGPFDRSAAILKPR